MLSTTLTTGYRNFMGLLITYFLFAICISFVCSVLEAVLFSVTPPFMESYPKIHPKGGRILRYLKANIDNAIGAILIVNLFANTVGAAGVGAQAVKIFGETWQGVVAFVMTISILYISEIVPKTIGATYWKSLILPASYAIMVLYMITLPLVYVSRIITHLFRNNATNQMSRDEVLAVMELGEKSGSINELEGDILESLIGQKSLSVQDIMTPKERIFALNEEMSIKEANKAIRDHKYSRIPLYRGAEGNICSLIYRKKILQAMLDKKKKKPLKHFASEVAFVDMNLTLFDLLKLFINKKEHLFVVIDKKKNLVGIVSLDDVISATLGVVYVPEQQSETQGVAENVPLDSKNVETSIENFEIMTKDADYTETNDIGAMENTERELDSKDIKFSLAQKD